MNERATNERATSGTDTSTTRPSEQTRRFEREDAGAEHEPDREPTEAEEREAEKHRLPPETAEHYREMSEIGAEARGEGRIEP